jgi:hypothetical protein
MIPKDPKWESRPAPLDDKAPIRKPLPGQLGLPLPKPEEADRPRRRRHGQGQTGPYGA